MAAERTAAARARRPASDAGARGRRPGGQRPRLGVLRRAERLARPPGRHVRRRRRRSRTARRSPTPGAWSCARPCSASSPCWPWPSVRRCRARPSSSRCPASGSSASRRRPRPAAGASTSRWPPSTAGSSCSCGSGGAWPASTAAAAACPSQTMMGVFALWSLPVTGHRPAVQPGRLLLRRPGRDGQPPHEPVPVRALRTRQQRLHGPGRPAVGQRPRALRPDVPPGRRLLRPDHLPQRAGHHRPAPPAGPGRRAAHRRLRARGWPSSTTGTAPSSSP